MNQNAPVVLPLSKQQRDYYGPIECVRDTLSILEIENEPGWNSRQQFAAINEAVVDLQALAESVARAIGIEPDDHQCDIDGLRLRLVTLIEELRGE
jgi:hypothetical protein